MVSWVGFPYAVVTYSQKERYAGRPSYDLNQSLNLARHGLFSFSTVPLAVITRLGFLLSFLAFLYFCYILVAALSNKTIPGWPSVIAVILIASGIQLVSLGVIAQYVGLIFEEVKHRPLYVVEISRWPYWGGRRGEWPTDRITLNSRMTASGPGSRISSMNMTPSVDSRS